MISFHWTICLSCFSLTQSTCLQLKMPMECIAEKGLHVILDIWTLEFSWKMDRGEKFSGTVSEDKESKGYFNPQLNKPRINFTVPSDKILQKCVWNKI